MLKKKQFIILLFSAMNVGNLYADHCPSISDIQQWHFHGWSLQLINDEQPKFDNLKFIEARWMTPSMRPNTGYGNYSCSYQYGAYRADYFILKKENFPRPTSSAWVVVCSDIKVCQRENPIECGW